MLVVQSFGHTMEVPVERLKFDPDPLGLTTGDYECQCPGCQISRKLEAMHAAGLVMKVVVPPEPDSPQYLKLNAPGGPVSPESYPLITAFDVHGSPDRPGSVSPERAAAEDQAKRPQLVTADGRQVPPWLSLAVWAFAWCVGMVMYPTIRLAMWFYPRPRLRLIREDASR